jgi:hypothetical protein
VIIYDAITAYDADRGQLISQPPEALPRVAVEVQPSWNVTDVLVASGHTQYQYHGEGLGNSTCDGQRTIVHLGEYVAPGADALVFTSTTGGPLYRGTFWPSVWKPAVRKAGLDGLRIHDLRHTYVSLMVAAGANPKEVSTWAGHSSVSFTLDRYGHLYDEHGDDVADRLDVMLSQGRPSTEVRTLRS